MRIVVFGTANTGPGYPRLDVITEGLRRRGVDVVRLLCPLFGTHADKLAVAGGSVRAVARLAPRLCRVYGRLARDYRAVGRHDAVLVGGMGHLDLLWLRRLRADRRIPIVFDPFVGLYDTIVGDRGLVAHGSLRARACLALDRSACKGADRILVDTEAMASHLAAQVGLPRERFRVVYQGQDDRVFHPVTRETTSDGPLDVVFAGTYVPLQGADTIVRAAVALGDVGRITMIGDGQARDDVERLATRLGVTNVRFETAWLDTDALAARLARADVCLGIFGTTDKASRVVPLKAVAALAVGRPLVTRDSAAAREVLRDGVDCRLVPAGDPDALATALRGLAVDRAACDRLGAAGRATFERVLSPDAIGGAVAAVLDEVIGTERRTRDAVLA